MFPSATLPPAAGGLARHSLAAPAAPTCAVRPRTRFADILYQTVPDGYTAQACAAAERRARPPLDASAEGS